MKIWGNRPPFANDWFSNYPVLFELISICSWLLPICSVILTLFIREIDEEDEEHEEIEGTRFIDGTSTSLLPADGDRNGDGKTEKKSKSWWSYLTFFLFSKYWVSFWNFICLAYFVDQCSTVVITFSF